MDSHPERVPSDSEEKPPRMAAKTNEGGSEETSRRLASGEKGKNRAVRRKSDRLLAVIALYFAMSSISPLFLNLIEHYDFIISIVFVIYTAIGYIAFTRVKKR